MYRWREQNGFSVGFPSVRSNLTGPSAGRGPSSRNATATLVGDTVTLLRGQHNFTMGGEYTQYDIWAKNQNVVPSVAFGLITSDPATSLFSNANFPNAAPADLTAAGNLYSLLTGRVNALNYDARIDEATGQYVISRTGTQRGRMRELGYFAQDACRLRPNLTVNAGLRYDVQYPFSAKNDSYSMATFADVCGISGVNADGTCNVFQSGFTPGIHPTFQNLKAGVSAYNTDRNNVAPSIGATWTPGERSGLLGKMFGKDGDTVFRGGYTRAFSRNGLTDVTTPYNRNPGIQIVTPQRADANGNLIPAGSTAPLLFRNSSALGPAPFPAAPVYPMTDLVTEDVNILDPHLKVPYADSYSVGIQRAVSRNMALEVRYVGTRSRDGWRYINYNEFNIYENGFLNEFKSAQTNLAANIAAGRGNTFAYTGAAGRYAPVFAAFSTASTRERAEPALLHHHHWTNATFLSYLAARDPRPFGFAQFSNANNAPASLMTSATLRANAAAAGLSANYFVANPDLLSGGIVTTNVDKTDYNSLQVELRRRLSQGLQFQTSYVFGHGEESVFTTFNRPLFMQRDAGTTGDLTHNFKANVVYDLPFGRGRRYASNANAVMERLVAGWQLGVTMQMNSGTLVDLGNVRLVGMTKDELQSLFKVRYDNVNRQIYMLPEDVITQTINAFSVRATSASGYSGATPTGRYFAPANGPECIEPDAARVRRRGARSLITNGPEQSPSASANEPRWSGTPTPVASEMLNAFNHANFNPVGGLGNNIANYQVIGQRAEYRPPFRS